MSSDEKGVENTKGVNEEQREKQRQFVSSTGQAYTDEQREKQRQFTSSTGQVCTDEIQGGGEHGAGDQPAEMGQVIDTNLGAEDPVLGAVIA